MPTKVFLCWSGARSRNLAQAVQKWLPGILGDRLMLSISTQIEKGADWLEELRRALNNSDCGILCLTPEAIESPWIHFEAGLIVRALSEGKSLEPSPTSERRVFPLLYGVDAQALHGPLGAYQSTSATEKDDAFRLIEAIHHLMPERERVAKTRLTELHGRRWEGFQAALEAIPRVSLREIMPAFESLFRRKTFQESIYDCLSQTWLDRYNGSRDTEMKLRAHQDTVRKACRPFVADVFEELVTALDSYTMGISKLVGKPEFPIDPKSGQVNFKNPGIARVCERQRKRIKSLVAGLADEKQAPVCDEAFRFDAAETAEEKKRLIHRKKAEFDHERAHPERQRRAEAAARLKQCAESNWELDRILYYHCREEQNDLNLNQELLRARREFEQVNSKTNRRLKTRSHASGGVSLMPLSYSLGPVEKALGRSRLDSQAAEVKSLCEDILALIDRPRMDEGSLIRAALFRISRRLRSGNPPL